MGVLPSFEHLPAVPLNPLLAADAPRAACRAPISAPRAPGRKADIVPVALVSRTRLAS